MRVLIAPDSFKGSLSAFDAAEAMRRGVLDALPEATMDCCPLADGGEGTARVLCEAGGGEWRRTRVTGPLGDALDAEWALLDDGRTAVIDMAAAAGLPLVPPDRRDPLRTTTYGVGELVRAALDVGATRIVVGAGGSATTDGGAGAAQALGVRLLGGFEPITGGQLKQIVRVDGTGRDPRLDSVDLVVACDVDLPLFGPEGAARVFGAQKGADPDGVRRLEAGLQHLAARVDGRPWDPGAGAAGGLAFGLAALCGASLERGADFVFDAVGLDGRLADCDLVLTGEGKLDEQSLGGKVVGNLARWAGHHKVPVAVVAGSVDVSEALLRAAGLEWWEALCDARVSVDEAAARAAEFVQRRAGALARRASEEGASPASPG